MSIHRLSTFELMFLRLETPDWPCHFAGLAMLDGEDLLDEHGSIDLAAVRARLDRRVQHLPALRRRLRPTPVGLGRSVWVDHRDFSIDDHVHHVVVDPPGAVPQLLAAVDEINGRLLDRARPLWELWLLTGLPDGRIGVLLKLHHAIADGLAAMVVLATLLDDRPDAPDPPPTTRASQPAPTTVALLADNVRSKVHALRRAVEALRTPAAVLRRARFTLQVLRSMGGQVAPSTSLNRPVQSGRRLGHLQIDLADARRTAHAHGATINQLVLAVWTGGLRRLLAARGETIDGLELVDGMATTLRPSTTDADSVDNRVGTVMLRLPVWQADPARRLVDIVDRTAAARTEQLPAGVVGPLAVLAGTPFGKWYVARQRANNVISTNVIGPSAPLYLLGARIRSLLPIIDLQGNIGLTLCALSYDGRLTLAVTADAHQFPDLDTLVAGMEEDLRVLRAADPPGRLDTTVGHPPGSTSDRSGTAHA